MLDTEHAFIEEIVEPAIRNGHDRLYFSLLTDANNGNDMEKRRALLDAYGRATGETVWECQCRITATKAR